MSEFYVNWVKMKFYERIQSLLLPWKLRKRQILAVNQNLSSVCFSLAKFQLLSCNLSLAMIWQMTHSQTAKTVFSHLKWNYQYCYAVSPRHVAFPITLIESHCIYYLEDLWIKDLCVCLSVTRIQQVWNLTGTFFSLKVCERWFCLALVTMRVSTHY